MSDETKAISNLEELNNAESEHVMDPTEPDEHEESTDPQQHHHTLTDVTMEGMNIPVSPEQTGVTVPSPKPAKSLKELVESKGLDVLLSEDNKTLIVKNTMSFSNSGKKTMEDYKPSLEDLDSINKDHANIDLSRDAILTFTLRSADLAVDRSYEHFTLGALQRMASLSVGKAFLMDHDWNTISHIGKIYDASVEDGALVQKVYMLNNEYNKKVIDNVLAGIYNKVSVGFGVDLGDMICDSCGSKSYYDEICPHTVGNLDERKGMTTVTIKDVSDYYEVSLVPVPAQRDAGIRRSMQQVKSIVEGSITSERPEIIVNPKALLEDLGQLLNKTFEDKIQQAFKSVFPLEKNKDSSDTINNSKSVLGDVAVPEDKQDSKGPDAEVKSLDTTPPVDAKPSHVSDEGKGEAPPKSDADEDDKKGVPMKDDEKSKGNSLSKAVKKLSKLAKAQKKSNKKQEKAAKNLIAAMEEKSKALESQVKEQSERLNVLYQVIEAAMSQSVETLAQDNNMRVSNQEKSVGSASQWYKELNNSFLSGGQ